MAEEVLAMLYSVEANPAFNYSLAESPGRDPTDLQLEAAKKLILDLEKSRDIYVNKETVLHAFRENVHLK